MSTTETNDRVRCICCAPDMTLHEAFASIATLLYDASEVLTTDPKRARRLLRATVKGLREHAATPPRESREAETILRALHGIHERVKRDELVEDNLE